MEAVASELRGRGASAAVTDEGEHDVRRRHLTDAGGDRLQAADARGVAEHGFETELAGHVDGRGLVWLELFGGGSDEDAHRQTPTTAWIRPGRR